MVKFNKIKKVLFIVNGFAGFYLSLVAWPKPAAAIEIKFQDMPATLAQDPAAYIQYFFTFGLGLVGFLAVAAIVIGGILYMTGSTVGKVDRAKTIIAGAITGVVLLLCSYLLFFIIDPSLVKLSPLTPENPGTLAAPVAPQQQPMNCGSTQVWSPSQGSCVPIPAGLGTTQCQQGSATCTEALCVPGGCAVAFQQWNSSQCCCIDLSTALCAQAQQAAQQQQTTTTYNCVNSVTTAIVSTYNDLDACAAACAGQGSCAQGQQQTTTLSATITGSGSAACSIISCGGSQVVEGKTLSISAAADYLSLQQQIQQACVAQGLSCNTLLTSTVDGQHASTCHNANSTQNGGTCGDFVITSTTCGGSIKNCTPSQKAQFLQIASQAMTVSNTVTSCLNEYLVAGSQYSTGGHFHCNF
jgi:hypothetical protein